MLTLESALQEKTSNAGIKVRSKITCMACGKQTQQADSSRFGTARGNSSAYAKTMYTLWKCPTCGSIKTLGKVDYESIYRDYPLKKRQLDLFARTGGQNLIRRLRDCGLQKNHTILDYGCGNGIFIDLMKASGYSNIDGYDPYETKYTARPPKQAYDCIVANDVIEHVEDPQSMMRDCLACLKPGGLLYVGTAQSDDVEMNDLKRHLMRLHLPYHRTIFSEDALHHIGDDLELKKIASWKRSYMDTRVPSCNYRFLDELNASLDHRIDRAFTSDAVRAVLSSPRLWFFALFGYFFPSANEPAVAWRKNQP